MNLLVVGTYPIVGGPLLSGEVGRAPDATISVDGTALPSSQGTSAMLGAAWAVSEHLGVGSVHALIAGDVGRGDGTRAVHEALPRIAATLEPGVVAFHYMQPVMALMRRSVAALAECCPKAMLVADAGGMYAAKAAGLARRFELMTPDVGEVGFLADPDVTHPAYVSRYLFGTAEFDPEQLAVSAYASGGASRVLLVKGATDRIVEDGEVRATIDAPDVPALEAIGGTGDTLTGLACAMLAAGFPTVDAALCASLANREAGRVAHVTPAARASDLVAVFPDVLREGLCEWGAGCARVCGPQ